MHPERLEPGRSAGEPAPGGAPAGPAPGGAPDSGRAHGAANTAAPDPEVVDRLRLLMEVAREINSTRSVDSVLSATLDHITRVMRAEAGAVLLLDEERNELYFYTASGARSKEAARVRVPLDGSIAGWVVRNRQPLLVEDTSRDPRHFKGVDQASSFRTRSVLAVPLQVKGRLLGVAEAINRLDRADSAFLPSDVELFAAFADQAAIAIENARLNEQLARRAEDLQDALARLEATHAELQATYASTLRALSAAIDLRDHETEGHSRRVTAYTLALARRLGIEDPVELGALERGALLHDLGKLAIPDRILHKPGPLTEEEWRVMRTHPEIGYNLVCRIPFLRDAAEIVLSHHERWDGTGYPRRLAGEQIPLGARLFALADVLDALTSDRPYRRALSLEEATRIVAGGSGTDFDPRVVQVFLQIERAEWERLREAAKA